MLILIVSLLFFLSGLAGLIYEVVWAKHLSLFLGNTAQAHTIVLATFMGGLALGYFVFGNVADRTKSVLGLYGWMEISIGLLAAWFPSALDFLGSFYIALLSRFGLGSPLALFAKFLLTVLLLLLPTTLMGGTLPVLSRLAVRSLGETESRVGWLYFVNSLGAVFGSILAGFVLIPWLGLNLCIIAAAIVNFLVGTGALVLRPLEKRERGAPTPLLVREPSYTPWQIRIAVLGIALSGAAALIYEIAWIRLLSLVLGSSTYSFSLMLSAFISGIALGSLAVTSRWCGRFEPYSLFALSELAVAVSIILTLPFYERLPFYFALIGNLLVRTPQTFWLHELIKFLACFLLMLLPTFFLGMTLPLASQIAARSLRRVGKDVGNVFAANTLGTIVGASAAGLILLPSLGLKRLIELGASANLLVGAFVLWSGPYLERKTKALISGVGLSLFAFYLYLYPSWDKNILSSGIFRERRPIATSYAEFKRKQHEEIVYYKDGANMTVAVTRDREKHLRLKVNGKTDASSRGDLPTQILLGELPLLLKPDAQSVLVIGLGSGITAGSVLRHPVERLDLVEISPEVVEGSRFFSEHNYGALRDPRLRLRLEDAKSFLKISPDRYDVVISEPSNPWIAGIASLYSVEFYEEVKKRLKPQGIIVQWIHTYEMTDETLRLVLRTLAASFEHVTLWSPMAADLIIVGSREPLPVDFQKSSSRLEEPKVREDLRRLGVDSLATIFSLQVTSDEQARKAAGKGRVNADLFPILEYEAPRAFFLGYTSEFLKAHDERRTSKTGLYFAEYLKKNPLGAKQLREITTYHLTHGSLGFDLAPVFLDQWLKKAPDDLEARWARAQIEQRRGNLEVALGELNFLLRRQPNDTRYLEAAARLEFQNYLNERSLLDSKGPAKALEYLERLLSLDTKKDRVYRLMAQILAAAGDFESALNHAVKAASYAEGSRGEFEPDFLWLEAAQRALDLDQVKDAIAYAQKALRHNPENRLAKKILKELQRLSP